MREVGIQQIFSGKMSMLMTPKELSLEVRFWLITRLT